MAETISREIFDISNVITYYSSEELHSRVKNWTKNVDIFSKELIILPVCQRLVYRHQGPYSTTLFL